MPDANLIEAKDLWKDIEGFESPECPDCTTLGEPTLDEDGYFCARCLEPLANGWEFDQQINKFKQLKEG